MISKFSYRAMVLSILFGHHFLHLLPFSYRRGSGPGDRFYQISFDKSPVRFAMHQLTIWSHSLVRIAFLLVMLTLIACTELRREEVFYLVVLSAECVVALTELVLIQAKGRTLMCVQNSMLLFNVKQAAHFGKSEFCAHDLTEPWIRRMALLGAGALVVMLPLLYTCSFADANFQILKLFYSTTSLIFPVSICRALFVGVGFWIAVNDFYLNFYFATAILLHGNFMIQWMRAFDFTCGATSIGRRWRLFLLYRAHQVWHFYLDEHVQSAIKPILPMIIGVIIVQLTALIHFRSQLELAYGCLVLVTVFALLLAMKITFDAINMVTLLSDLSVVSARRLVCSDHGSSHVSLTHCNSMAPITWTIFGVRVTPLTFASILENLILFVLIHLLTFYGHLS